MDTNFKEKVNVDAIAITLSDPDHEYFKALNVDKKLKFEKERISFASVKDYHSGSLVIQFMNTQNIDKIK